MRSTAPGCRLAWDCGTGNGQAAVALAFDFDRVIATDASEKQIANAEPHDRVEYRVAPAENSRIESGTVDLTMVAQALHWFDLDRFYAEARRVLKLDGVLAASAYNLLHINPAIGERPCGFRPGEAAADDVDHAASGRNNQASVD